MGLTNILFSAFEISHLGFFSNFLRDGYARGYYLLAANMDSFSHCWTYPMTGIDDLVYGYLDSSVDVQTQVECRSQELGCGYSLVLGLMHV